MDVAFLFYNGVSLLFRESVARKNLMRQFAFKGRYLPLSAYGLYDLRGHLYFKAYKEKKH